MKKTIGLLIAIMACSNLPSIAMEQQNTHVVIVPGQNGLGGQNIDKIFPYFGSQPELQHHVKTPNWTTDFGQTQCQSYLQQKMNTLNNNDKAIIHASSQGTATAINYIAKNFKKTGALILEAVMLSGNSAIEHTVENLMLPGATSLPGSYYWMPYVAKLLYPFYSPAGEQAIFNVDKLPKDLPIIILHHTQDQQLSYKDAQALYAFLYQTQQNKNVYLMSKESLYKGHVLLLKNTSDENSLQKINAINQILQKHGLLPKTETLTYELNRKKENQEEKKEEYQPKVQPEWLKHFHDLRNKEKNIRNIDWGIKVIFYSFFAYIIYNIGLAEKLLNQIHSA